MSGIDALGWSNFSQPAKKNDEASLEGLLKVLMEEMRRKDESGFGRQQAAGEESRKRSLGGELGGASEVQRAHIRSRGNPQAAVSAAGTVGMINRGKLLEAHGMDPRAPYVSVRKPGETDDEYVSRTQTARDAHESRRTVAADKNRARTAADKERIRKTGATPRAMVVSADQRQPGRYERAARAERNWNESLPAETADDRAIESSQFANVAAGRPPLGALPEWKPDGYTATSQLGQGPKRSISGQDPGYLADRSQYVMDEEERLLRSLAGIGL